MSSTDIMSCLECRNRKLKCDRTQPVCGKCQRTNRECCYPERRISKGTQRRDRKILEARLGAVERKLAASRAQDTESLKESHTLSESNTPDQQRSEPSSETDKMDLTQNLDAARNSATNGSRIRVAGREQFRGQNPRDDSHRSSSLGVQHNSPPEHMRKELFQVYFDRIHECLPILHKQRFYDALNLVPTLQPPMSLQYAMWTLASSVTHKYKHLCDILYRRARSCAQDSEDADIGDSFVSLRSAQTWHLIATYEAQRMYATRAWISTGKCVRMVQLMGLQHMDGLKQMDQSSKPENIIDMEEKRRIFWAAFLGDRWASALSGWPMTINESEIFTNMPSSDGAFIRGSKEPGLSLEDLLVDNGASSLTSSYTGTILAVTLLCRNFGHILADTKPELSDNTSNVEFWKRHRNLDNILSNTFMCLPEYLRISETLRDPNAFFLNMTMHAATICLHQMAVRKLTMQDDQASFLSQSVNRCIASARAISTATRLFSHQDLSRINPWTGFCLYVAGLVYCHDLRLSYDPTQDGLSNVTFLLAVMKSIGMYQPVTEYFTVQLEIELEAAQRGRNCSQRQGRMLCSPGSHRSASTESTPNDGEESWTSFPMGDLPDRSLNPPFKQPLAGILLRGCPAEADAEARSRRTNNDSPSNTSSPRRQAQGRDTGDVFAGGMVPSNSPGIDSENHSILSAKRSDDRGISHVENSSHPMEPNDYMRIKNGNPVALDWNRNFTTQSQPFRPYDHTEKEYQLWRT